MTKSKFLVRFECGCIGFVPDAEGRSWVISCCDGDGEYYLSHRAFDKKWDYVDFEVEHDLMDKLATLVCEGLRLREIQSALGINRLANQMHQLERRARHCSPTEDSSRTVRLTEEDQK